jgi:hypothetical protein
MSEVNYANEYNAIGSIVGVLFPTSDLTYWARAKHRCPRTSLAEKRATDRPMQELLLSSHAGD